MGLERGGNLLVEFSPLIFGTSYLRLAHGLSLPSGGCAVDSTYYAVRSDDPSVLAQVRSAFHDVVDYEHPVA